MKGQTILYVGDLSYADDHPFHDNNRWDTWGRFIERVAAYQPWIWTAGNHELDFAPELVCLKYLRTLQVVLNWSFHYLLLELLYLYRRFLFVMFIHFSFVLELLLFMQKLQ